MNEEQKTETAPAAEAPKEAPQGKAYLVTFNGDYQDVTVEAFDSKEKAVKASGKSPKEKSLVIQDASDLTQFDLNQLLQIYNGVNGTSLSRFRTLESGRERILTSIKALASIEGGAANDADASDNQEGQDDMAAKKAVKKKAAPKPAGERKKRKSQVDPDKKIQHTEKWKELKLREGSAREKDFERMKQGTKIQTYLDNKGTAANIRFAVSKGYIKLVSSE